jgi:molybdopterin-guanine dinucleotide biosynthesis protein A
LHAGLRAAGHDPVLALATDMPLVNPTLVAYLVELARDVDVVMPWVMPSQAERGEVEREPLHAVYRHSCLPAIEARLAAGQRRMISFLPDVRVRDVLPTEILPLDPGLLSFINANTPEDWDRVRSLL